MKIELYPTNRRWGFTLIEMLVVVAIIGLLSSIILVGLGDVRKEARDTRRISDIRQMQNALEIYYSANQRYPADVYELPGTPYDPTPDPLSGDLRKYGYERINLNSYRMGACLEGSRPTGVSHIAEPLTRGIYNYGEGCNCDDREGHAYCIKS